MDAIAVPEKTVLPFELAEEAVVPLVTAAHLLGLSYQTCRNHVLRGELSGFRIGARWLVRVQSVRDLLETEE